MSPDNSAFSKDRRIAYVLIPHFAAAVERRERPGLEGKPTIVGGQPYEGGQVFDTSEEAEEHGVRIGIPLSQAEELCPEAIFLPLDEEKYRQAFSQVLKVLELFSPKIEPQGLGCAYLDVTGCQGLFGEDEVLARKIAQAIQNETGLSALVGVAGSRFTARIAASCAGYENTRVVTPGEERGFLAPLPVEILTENQELLRRLDLLGIERVGEYGTLPASDVPVQFGPNGQMAHQLALGMGGHHVVVQEMPPLLEEGIDLWEPIESLEGLKLQVDGIVDHLAFRLEQGGWMCREAKITLMMSDDRVKEMRLSLSEPTASVSELKGRIERLLRQQRYGSGVLGIRISLDGLCGLDGKQLGLEIVDIHQRERLQKVVSHLRARFGPGRIKRAVLRDIRSLIPEKRFLLLEYGAELYSG